jgi:hypothetical protein
VTLKIVRAATGKYDNLGTAVEEFRQPFLPPALSIAPHPAIALTSLGLAGLAGLCFLSVREAPRIELMFTGETNPPLVSTNVAQKRDADVNVVSHIPTDSHAGASPDRTAALIPPWSVPNDGEASKTVVDDASSAPRSMPRASVANPSRNANPISQQGFAYSIQGGDIIEGIVLRHFGSKAKTRSVIEANPQLRDVNRIYPGDTVFLPAESAGRNEKGIR